MGASASGPIGSESFVAELRDIPHALSDLSEVQRLGRVASVESVHYGHQRRQSHLTDQLACRQPNGLRADRVGQMQFRRLHCRIPRAMYAATIWMTSTEYSPGTCTLGCSA